MTRKEIAHQYIKLLAVGDIKSIISLFSKDGKVFSPIYGEKDATSFYHQLAGDTTKSELMTKGIFENLETKEIALYFEYIWTVKTGKVVKFDVIDILQFDDQDKITNLRIIYDTVRSRKLVEEINEKGD